MLVHDAPLHLEGRRELAAFDREVARQDREPVDEHLVRLARIPLVDGALEDRDDPRFLDEIVHGHAGEAVVLRPTRELLEVRDEKAGQEFPAVADDDGERNERMTLEMPLDRSRSDVLAVGVDEDFFLPVRDHQEAVLVDPPDVSRVEPAVRVDGLCGLLRLVEIALHDVRPTSQDLPVRRDAAFDAGHHLPHGAEPPRGRTGECDDRARLREAVALVDLDPDRPEELREILCERRAAGDREAKAGPQSRAYLAVHEPLVQEVLEGEAETRRLLLRAEHRDLLPGLDRPREEFLLARRRLRQILLHASVNLLVDAWDRTEEVRVHLGEVVSQLFDRLRVRDRGGPMVISVLERALQDVREGQEREGDRSGVEGQNRTGRDDVRDEVALHEHRALRLSRRSGRVDEGREVGGLARVGALLEGRGVGRVRDAARLQNGRVRCRARKRRSVEHDDVLHRLLDLGRGFLRRENLCGLLGRRREGDGRAGVLEKVRHLLDDHRREDRNEDRAVTLAGEVHDRPLRPVVREQGHTPALLHTEALEGARNRFDTIHEFGRRDGNPLPALLLEQQIRLRRIREIPENVDECSWSHRKPPLPVPEPHGL